MQEKSSPFNEVKDFQSATLLEKRPRQRCFRANFTRFLRSASSFMSLKRLSWIFKLSSMSRYHNKNIKLSIAAVFLTKFPTLKMFLSLQINLEAISPLWFTLILCVCQMAWVRGFVGGESIDVMFAVSNCVRNFSARRLRREMIWWRKERLNVYITLKRSVTGYTSFGQMISEDQQWVSNEQWISAHELLSTISKVLPVIFHSKFNLIGNSGAMDSFQGKC